MAQVSRRPSLFHCRNVPGNNGNNQPMAKVITPRRINLLLITSLILLVVVGLIYGGFRLLGSLRRAGRQFGMSIDLGQAIMSRNYRTVESLLRAGADPNAADMDDSLLLARQQKDDKMVALLLRFGANPSKSLLDARNVEDTQALLRLGADPNAHVSYDGWTPLMQHCTFGSPEIARFLLAHGGDPTVRDNDGKSILERVDYAAGNHPESAAAYAQIREMIAQALSRRRK